MGRLLGIACAAGALAAACASVLGIEERRRAPATDGAGAGSGAAGAQAGGPGDASGGAASGAGATSGAPGAGGTAGSFGTGGASGSSGSAGDAGTGGSGVGAGGTGGTTMDPCNFVDDDGDGIVDGDGGWVPGPWRVVLHQAMAIGRPGPIQAVGLDGDGVLVAGINGDPGSRIGWVAVVDADGAVRRFDTQPVSGDGGVAVSGHWNRPDAAVLFGAGCAACDLSVWRVDPSGILDGPHPIPVPFRPAVLGLAPTDPDFVALFRGISNELRLGVVQFPMMVPFDRFLGHSGTAGSIASRGSRIGTIAHTGSEIRVGVYDPGLGTISDEAATIPPSAFLAPTRSIAAAPPTSPEPDFVVLTDRGLATVDTNGVVSPPSTPFPVGYRPFDLVEVGGGMVVASLVGTSSISLRRVAPVDLARLGPPDVTLPVQGSMALGVALARTSQGLHVFATNDTSRDVEVSVVRCP